VGCILSPLRGYGPPLWLPDFLHVFGATLAASSRSAYLLVTGSFLSPLAGLFVFLWFHTHGLRRGVHSFAASRLRSDLQMYAGLHFFRRSVPALGFCKRLRETVFFNKLG
jgi:hypothetical protein